jgi:glutathione synthase/RimK-type ligase-like ATP-grasp enzyme
VNATGRAARLAFVTAADLGHPDDDETPIRAACATAGVDATWEVWDDPAVDWAAYDRVVIRSPWDYHERVDEFLAWSDRVESVARLVNPAAVLRWNSHKRYLLELEAAGVPIVPTELVTGDRRSALHPIADRRGWPDVVVKPAVSGGAKGTTRHVADDPAGERALAALLAEGDALVQPYLPEIEAHGETSVIVLGGVPTHAVSKRPIDGDFRVQVQYGGRDHPVVATSAELALAAAAVDAAERVGPVVYARVDCLTVDGSPRLMELEVLEPSLFLHLAPPAAAAALVAAVLAA